MIDSPEFRNLCVAIDRYYGNDPHLGAAHPETIKAIGFAVAQAIEVSKARPEKYANEPWIGIDAGEHFEHAVTHMDCAGDALEYGGEKWLDDDGLPNAAHAILCGAFGLYLHSKDRA